jgi:hypothetical protein
MKNMINDWEPETKSLITSLIAAGFSILSGNNGEDEFEFRADEEDKFIAELIACDEARLYFSKGGKRGWIYLVLGNEPGVIASDYTCNEVYAKELDAVTDAHYKSWSDKKQPTKPSPY